MAATPKGKKSSGSLDLEFVWAKETPGTHQFKEPEQAGRPAMGSMYLTKEALAELGWSGKDEDLEVTIKVKGA